MLEYPTRHTVEAGFVLNKIFFVAFNVGKEIVLIHGIIILLRMDGDKAGFSFIILSIKY